MKDLKQNKVMSISKEYQKSSDELIRAKGSEYLFSDLFPEKNMEE